ncbi:unnamed protein product [Mytilus edulis]|uniref:Uncharacterized protein n=1 Tax=Mytilus edulis TaxID=6550 RepID=A0A8S3UHD4_MYTED|nr:unnamed protein product [Mytilus edulis]
MLRRGTRKRTASARAGVRRTPVVSKGVSSRASVQSSMTVTRPEAIYTSSGHDGAAIPTTATVSTTRMLMPTFSSNQDNSVHIPDMLPWQPRRAIDLQPTVDNTQFVSQTGNVTNNDYVQIPNRIESVHENLGINVTQSIKEKILKGEFIDLACLLNNSVNTGSDKQKLTWAQGEFILQPISQQSKITNIEKWTDAFIIFIYIYCAVHVNRFKELLKYMHTIRLGAQRNQGMGWKNYDEQYRLRKAHEPSSLWSNIDNELWLLYMQPVNTISNVSLNVSNSNIQDSSGHGNKCYSYNYEGSCWKTPCFYSHLCLRCNGSHPIINCQRQLGNVRPHVGNTQYNTGSQFQFRAPGAQYRAGPQFQFRPRSAESRVRFSPRNATQFTQARSRPNIRTMATW